MQVYCSAISIGRHISSGQLGGYLWFHMNTIGNDLCNNVCQGGSLTRFGNCNSDGMVFDEKGECIRSLNMPCKLLYFGDGGSPLTSLTAAIGTSYAS